MKIPENKKNANHIVKLFILSIVFTCFISSISYAAIVMTNLNPADYIAGVEIDQTPIFSQDGITIAPDRFAVDERRDDNISVYFTIKNVTASDVEIMPLFDTFVNNHVIHSGITSVTVSAGETVTTPLLFLETYYFFPKAGIQYIETLDVRFTYKNINNNASSNRTELLTIHTRSERTTTATDLSSKLIYDQNGINIRVSNDIIITPGAHSLIYSFTNNTTDQIRLMVDILEINHEPANASILDLSKSAIIGNTNKTHDSPIILKLRDDNPTPPVNQCKVHLYCQIVKTDSTGSKYLEPLEIGEFEYIFN